MIVDFADRHHRKLLEHSLEGLNTYYGEHEHDGARPPIPEQRGGWEVLAGPVAVLGKVPESIAHRARDSRRFWIHLLMTIDESILHVVSITAQDNQHYPIPPPPSRRRRPPPARLYQVGEADIDEAVAKLASDDLAVPVTVPVTETVDAFAAPLDQAPKANLDHAQLVHLKLRAEKHYIVTADANLRAMSQEHPFSQVCLTTLKEWSVRGKWTKKRARFWQAVRQRWLKQGIRHAMTRQVADWSATMRAHGEREQEQET